MKSVHLLDAILIYNKVILFKEEKERKRFFFTLMNMDGCMCMYDHLMNSLHAPPVGLFVPFVSSCRSSPLVFLV